MSDLAELIEDPAVARMLLNALVRDTAVQTRQNGLVVSSKWREVVEVLRVAAGADSACFARETAPSSVDVGTGQGFVSAGSAATECGVSVQYVRRLAHGGRIRSERVGRDWRVDLDSLKSVLRRTA